jgi:hypothetical protein
LSNRHCYTPVDLSRRGFCIAKIKEADTGTVNDSWGIHPKCLMEPKLALIAATVSLGLSVQMPPLVLIALFGGGMGKKNRGAFYFLLS